MFINEAKKREIVKGYSKFKSDFKSLKKNERLLFWVSLKDGINVLRMFRDKHELYNFVRKEKKGKLISLRAYKMSVYNIMNANPRITFRASYFSGRGVTESDVNANCLMEVYNYVTLLIGHEEAEKFKKAVNLIKYLTGSNYATLLKHLAETNFNYSKEFIEKDINGSEKLESDSPLNLLATMASHRDTVDSGRDSHKYKTYLTQKIKDSFNRKTYDYPDYLYLDKDYGDAVSFDYSRYIMKSIFDTL